MNKIKRYCFIYPIKKHLYLGWILEKKPLEIYADNAKQFTLYPEKQIEYVVLGFSEKSVTNKLEKWINKNVDLEAEN